MSEWTSGDLVSSAKMNQKTVCVKATAPSTTYAGQIWYDTANNALNVRNSANNAWLTLNQSLSTTSSPTFPSLTLTTDVTVDKVKMRSGVIRYSSDNMLTKSLYLENALGFRIPYKVEKWNSTNSAWDDITASATWGHLTDNKPSTRVSFGQFCEADHTVKIRFYYDSGGTWISPADTLVINRQHLSFIDYIKVEQATDAAMTTDLQTLKEYSTPISGGDSLDIIPTSNWWRRYLRIELDLRETNTSYYNDLFIKEIMYMSPAFYGNSRLLESLIPIGWNYNKEVYFSNLIRPTVNNSYDIGTSSYKFRDAYLSGNLNVDGTVDGVDISALLIKTSKITDLSTIWDKTTKIAYGDTNFANQSLNTTSNVRFNQLTSSSYIYAPSFEHFKLNGGLTNKVLGVDVFALTDNPKSAFLWHDLFAFCTTGTPVFETTSNGTDWDAATLDKNLFSQKEHQSITVIDYPSKIGCRWTWNSTSFAWSCGRWLLISFTYGSTVTITFESSPNGIDWTLRHTSSNTYSYLPCWFYVQDYGGHHYLRLTMIQTAGTSGIRLSAIKLLTYRWGREGRGSEYEFPYNWDANRNLITYGNISLPAGATVDGVDISALLLKTTKIADLSTIWDKTTKIAFADTTITKADLGLGNVENTALSTWTGSSNITTVGTLASLTVSTTMVIPVLASDPVNPAEGQIWIVSS